jgi:dihydropteroate synthase
MTNGVYLRPTGFIYGQAAKQAATSGHAGLLAGTSIAFATLEMFEGAPGDTASELRPFSDLMSSGETATLEILSAITAPRVPIGGLSLDRPRIMGVVNVTPDSFSDGGLLAGPEDAIAHALGLAREGADILDIGGESTRPDSDPVSEDEEAARVLPVIEGLKDAGPLISVDTRKSAIMKKAASAGAHILNDVSALTHDPNSLKVAAESGLPVVLMHAQGDPKTMQEDPVYANVLLEVYDTLSARIAACDAAGIDRSRIIADPGIGFGKTLQHNLELLRGLSLFHGLGVALLLGASRKRFIGTLSDEPDPRVREPGSIAAALAGIAQGVQLVRVHDVAATRQALSVWCAINC